MLYLPRLFVYHTETAAPARSESSERFKVMERKLLKGIMNPVHDRGLDIGAAAGMADISSYLDPWLQIKIRAGAGR